LEQLNILNSLYQNELRLFKNFFQPVIKLVLKERIGGKIHRKYDIPKTPYHRLMESNHIPKKTKQKLEKTYLSLNPAQLKRTIDDKLNILYKSNHKPQRSNLKKLSVRFLTAQSNPVSVR